MTASKLPHKKNGESKIIRVEVYRPEYKPAWNSFVSRSKNGTFLFLRDYMDYHADRFLDHSLMFFNGTRLVALLPANIEKTTLYSHEGLTFGGVVSDFEMSQELMLDIFLQLLEHCKAQGYKEVVYKSTPYIFHSAPADEDLYALYTHNARLSARNSASCICLPLNRKLSDSRKDNIRKAKKANLAVEESKDFASFMQIAKKTLGQRHRVSPVHSIKEMELLASRFPNNIKLFVSHKNGSMLAGLIIYESPNVAHVQYAANSQEGWRIGAQDIVENYLIHDYYKNKKFFDFGISTEKQGRVLNLGLIKRKEGFGASSVMYDTYLMKVSS